MLENYRKFTLLGGIPLTESPTRSRSAWMIAGIAALLSLLFLQLFLATRRNSVTWDEDNHIFAGYMSWKHGDFGLNPEHPPLVKMVAAIPLLDLPLNLPVPQKRQFKLEGFLEGQDFLFHNNADQILFRARMAASILTFILAILIFLAAREMFGVVAAFIALGLLVFDPTLVAHGAFVTTDVGLSCFLFASVYAFYRYVKSPSLWRLLLVGLAAGLALAAKHTGILVFPILLLLAVVEFFRSESAKENPSASRKSRAVRLAGALVLSSVIAVAVLWAFYGFRYSARGPDLQMNPSLPEFISTLSRPHEVFLLSAAARWHLLPESYLYGLTDVRTMGDFYSTYIFGEVYPHGVWFYFPSAIAIKSSLTFLILLVVALWSIFTRKFTEKRELWFLIIPPVFYLMIAINSGINIGVRHILPVYLFLWVIVAAAAARLIQRDRRWAYALVALLVFQAISVTRVFPAYVAYANELWGGPANTYKYLSDSNADWAQQLKATKQYLDQHGIKDCWFIYFADGVVDTSYYGIPCKPLPTMDTLWVNKPADAPPAIDGTVLISAGDLSGYEFGRGVLNPYEQFKKIPPVDSIQYGILVYQGHFEIPLAAALSHAQKADNLLAEKRLEEALSEAQQAVALAPDAVKSNATLGDVLTAMQKPEEARKSYEKALTLAKIVEPEFQTGPAYWLGQKLAAK